MSEVPDTPMRFVRIKEGGAKEEFTFAPFPPRRQDVPHGMMIVPLSEIIGDGDGELRHLSYDDPPHGMTADEWREKLLAEARLAQDGEHFAYSLSHALLKDLVMSHGCHPARAIPAIVEFAAKVYAEATGTV